MAKSRKEYYEENKEKELKNCKEYYEKNKEFYTEYKKNYQIENKEKIKERKRKYYEANKEKINDSLKEYRKEYYQKNKDVAKDYYQKNKETAKEYQLKNKYKINQRLKERRENDPLYKLTNNLRSSINNALKMKGYVKESRTHEILGCSYEHFKEYIEIFFVEDRAWMNWDNYGNPKDGIFETNKSWDIDHIIPLSSAKNEEELLELCKYTNLQPLCSYHNRWIKSDNI